MRRNSAVVCLWATALLAGCGDGNDSDAPELFGRLAPGALVSDLTSSERRMFCEDVEVLLAEADYRESLCRVITVSSIRNFELSGGDCEDSVDSCAADVATGDCTLKSAQSAADCHATVGEIKRCLNDQRLNTIALAESYSCADPAAAPSSGASEQNLSSCEVVKAKCPTFE